ncbi:hypothetical protein [Pseudomonas oryzihabitans]|uniref:hypothetical protein n=1 Tax=Pseudomonas oryzihabitans TaxID=47885 RepID=UPI0011A56255|nr:hypothetical protein [Pseudomonas psychrotolerans]
MFVIKQTILSLVLDPKKANAAIAGRHRTAKHLEWNAQGFARRYRALLQVALSTPLNTKARASGEEPGYHEDRQLAEGGRYGSERLGFTKPWRPDNLPPEKLPL